MYFDAWFDKAKRLEVGATLFIQVSSSKEQTVVAKKLRELKEEHLAIDPEQALSIHIDVMEKGGNKFVYLKKMHVTPTIGFIRNKSGEMSKIDIADEIYRKRVIKLMLMDGYNKEGIERDLGPLTKEEIEDFFPEK